MNSFNERKENTSTTPLAVLGLGGRAGYSSEDQAAIERGVRQASYFSLFSIPDPASPSAAIPLVPSIPALAAGFTVHEGLHRFEVTEPEPNPVCGFRVSQSISKNYVARVHMKMIPMPNNFEAAADRVPPPTILLPFLSQRFCALDGRLDILDGAGSGFRAFGCGRTFPATVGGTSQIRLASVLDIGEGFGRLAGFKGIGIVSGEIEPPGGFAFNTLFRLIDPKGKFRSHTPVPPLRSSDDPKPGTVFMPFLSEPDPGHPLTVQSSPDGTHVFIQVGELLRPVRLNFEVGASEGIRSRTTVGPVVGKHRATLVVDLSNPKAVIPAYSKNDEFSFFDRDHKAIGILRADLFEARIFPTELQRLGAPILRIGGIAPTLSGTGQFKNPVGMVSLNGAFSLVTGAISSMYMIRLSDPLGLFSQTLR